MIGLTCPKCRQGISDAALDAGSCPSCGYDGPMVLGPAGAKWAWLAATVAVVVTGVAVGGYLLVPRDGRPAAALGPAVAAATPAPEPQPPTPTPPAPAPQPRPKEVPTATPKPDPPPNPVGEPKPPPAELVQPLKPGPPPEPIPEPVRPFVKPGPVVRIDPKEVREKHLDNPTGVATVADMNRDDRLTLTGKVRVLRIGTVAGKAVLDASGLEAEEVVVSGDISENAVVKLNAPKGRVTVGGHVVGVAKLTVTAPGGEFVVSAGSGKLGGACEVSVTAKRVAVRGPMAGTAKLVITLTADGSAQFGTIEDKAVVLYKE